MKDLKKTVGSGKEILKGIWLSFFYGAKIGVIGANGSGKSTLLKIMAGLDEEYQGECFAAEGVTRGYLPQDPQLEAGKTVREVVEEGVASTRALLDEFNAVSDRFAEPLEADEMDRLLAQQAEIQDKIDAAGGWELDQAVEQAMDALRCPPPDAEVSHLSGGERRRVALCRLLLQKPDLLLLDEPTNHLDAESVAWLEVFLREYDGTVIIVTHDRYFLDNVTKWVLELDRGKGVPWEGNYSSWLEQKQEQLERSEKQATIRKRTLQRELQWIRMTPKDRQLKARARLKNYEALLEDDSDQRAGTVEIYIPPGPRLGDVVIEAEGLTKGFGDRLLFDNLDFRVPAGAIVGLVGANGAGKTTLFRMITGQESPDDGSLNIGQTAKLAYVEQLRSALEEDRTVWEVVSGGEDVFQLGHRKVNSRAYVSSFGFKGSDQQKSVRVLSGGERNRVHLAMMLKQGANVLLLDEPTNDLDVDTLRALEDGLLDFAGCVLVISHDRWFLDRVATHILAFEGDSSVVWYDGGYSDYVVDRKKRLGADAKGPHRIKYRKFSRSS